MGRSSKSNQRDGQTISKNVTENEVMSQRNNNFEFRYMTMKLVKETPKTKVWEIRNKNHGELLGEVKWDFCWNQYVFEIDGKKFSSECLKDIFIFLSLMTGEHAEEVISRA